jgi:hypothetical protein
MHTLGDRGHTLSNLPVRSDKSASGKLPIPLAVSRYIGQVKFASADRGTKSTVSRYSANWTQVVLGCLM